MKAVLQSKPQVKWAHTLFAWIVWYEIVLHLATSLFVSSGFASWSALMVPGFGFLACLLLCIPIFVPGDFTRQGHRIFHLAIGGSSIAVCTAHTLDSSSATFVGIGSLVAALCGIWVVRKQPVKTEVEFGARYDLFRIDVPAASYDFCCKFQDGFRRAAWVERITRDGKPYYQAVVLVPSNKTEGKTEEEKKSMECKRLYRVPLSPYTRAPRDLNIIAADDAMIERSVRSLKVSDSDEKLKVDNDSGEDIRTVMQKYAHVWLRAGNCYFVGEELRSAYPRMAIRYADFEGTA
ncbi:hypothetical protein S40288_11794, partial [Stachybotrys chartarum IBT 40288]